MTTLAHQVVQYLFGRRTLLLTAWLLVLGVAAGRLHHSWHAFDDKLPLGDPKRRPDGNHGHTTIDFGGQWLMGRMLTRGYGRQLYQRRYQWYVAQKAFPRSAEAPEAATHDAEQLLEWFIGSDDAQWAKTSAAIATPLGGTNVLQTLVLAQAVAPHWSPERLQRLQHPPDRLGVGGPLYPPIQAFVFAPLALGDHPQWAYHVTQTILIVLAFTAGLAGSFMTRGRVPWSVATLLVLLWPGFRHGVDLGQNAPLTLNIVLWGWLLATRGRYVTAGIVWGLLAFKPVWGMAFFLVPLLLRRWQMCLAMVLSGAGLAALTLPVVGWQAWWDWFYVGRQASALYDVDANWVRLSRDLFGLPRRVLLDWSLPRDQRETPLAFAVSWAMWLMVLEIALRWHTLRGRYDRSPTGMTTVFLFLTAYLCCYHYMFYDVLLAIVPLFVLLAEPGRCWRPIIVGDLPPVAQTSTTHDRCGWLRWPTPTALGPTSANGSTVLLLNSAILTLVALLLGIDLVLVGLDVRIAVGFGYFSETIHSAGQTTEWVPTVHVGTDIYHASETVAILVWWWICGVKMLFAPGAERSP